MFYDFKTYNYDTSEKKWKTNFSPQDYKRQLKLRENLVNSTNSKIVLKKGSKINLVIAKKLQDEGLKSILVDTNFFIGKYIVNDLTNPSNENDIILQSGSSIEEGNLESIIKNNVKSLTIADVNPITKGPYLIDTLAIDKNNNKEEAINDIYRVLRPGEPPSFDVANEIFKNLFFTSQRYDLSDVGRVKINTKLNLNCKDDITILRNDDIIAIIKHMLD